ncbi:conserved phage C-terminal domain-containing protein [Serratia proteamaculans]|uniref:Conserved phage C-terminal domain-containing protein n=1 Tax=Serratia proteamaculans TaxID=28151 RepID=A0ABS0TS03_SERPR|nr:conserved phage C-terminal domain-containing protein [Serratia proteamaculans]MBI6181126.1 conserved phage C-terminal domain-containing protein [Serratia proteamaculans]
MSRLIQLLDRPIAYQPAFADLRVGKVKSGPVAAVFLSQLVYWYNRMDSEWLYKTQADITKETKLTRDEQETARKRLIALGVIDEARRGVPGKMHFRINVERLEVLLMGEPIEKQKNEEPPQSEKGECHNVETPQSTVVDSHNVETPQSTMVQPTEQECGNPALFPTGDYTEITSKEKPPLTPPPVDNPEAGQNQTAGEVFYFLNSLLGVKTQPDQQALRFILDRLADGYSRAELELVAEHRTEQLLKNPKLAHMLSPNLLFAAGSFGAYLVAATAWQKKRTQQAARVAAVEQQRQSPPTGDAPEIDFAGSFDRLFVEGLPPENPAEKLAWQHVQKYGFKSPGDEVASRKEWVVILSKKNAVAGRSEA